MNNGDTSMGLRDRITVRTEDKIGRALSDLLESPLLSGALGRAFDAREKAAQAQELAMGALNLPSAADIERLTRRLRSVSQRLEGIEDGVSRLDRGTGARLTAIEQQLERLASSVQALSERSQAPSSARGSAAASKPARTASRAKSTRAASGHRGDRGGARPQS